MRKKNKGIFLPRPHVNCSASAILISTLEDLDSILAVGHVSCFEIFDELQREIFDRFKKDCLTFAQDMMLSIEDRDEIARRIREPYTKG